MNFTREPLIETIISAKDGHKLAIKSSKSLEGEEYLVDAVEVVSFGNTFFYRSQERAKAFFLPSSDYEIQEVKETRLVIKNPTIEKSVKIGGGKEAGKAPKAAPLQDEAPLAKEEESAKVDLKREKKRYRKNRKSPDEVSAVSPLPENKEGEKSPEKAAPAPVKVPQPGVFSHLLKPPERLISDSIEKYRREDPNSPYHQNRTPDKSGKESSPEDAAKEAPSMDDKELFSEPPKPGEQLEEILLDDASPLVFSPMDIEEASLKKDGPNLSKEEN